MKTEKRYALTQEQKDQVKTWIRAGYTAPQIEGLARNQGWVVKAANVQNVYIPMVRAEFREHIDKSSLSTSWFNKEFRAEKASQIADMLFERIMNGEMFNEEVTQREGKFGPETTTKPVYFAGMIKNWKDLVDTIANELGQRKQTVDLNFNKNQNLNLSVLVEKIYEQDSNVDRQLEGAEIIDVPSLEDFADDKGFMQIVDEQTDDEIKNVVDTEDHGDSVL